MATAREIMTGRPECIGENETLEEAARKTLRFDIGSMPICGDDKRLKGMISDRDIVTKFVAQGGDPRTTRAGELGEGKPFTIGADDSIEETIKIMEEHQVRRLPVIDGHQLVGMPSQADIAKNYPEDRGRRIAQVDLGRVGAAARGGGAVPRRPHRLHEWHHGLRRTAAPARPGRSGRSPSMARAFLHSDFRTRFSGSVPSAQATSWRFRSAVMRGRKASVFPPLCGTISALGNSQIGWSAGSGSGS